MDAENYVILLRNFKDYFWLSCKNNNVLSCLVL